MIPYKYMEIFNKIKYWFNPRQKWLIKKIPNNWVDKDTLLEICIFESLKHFVEGEKAFEILSSTNPPEQEKFMKELESNYRLIVDDLPILESLLNDAYDKIPKWNMEDIKEIDYYATYGEVELIEKQIEDLKTKVMLWVITNKGWLWT